MESNTQKRKRVKSEGTEKLYEDEKWLAVRPTTIEASRLYGMGGRWCTSMKNDRFKCFFDAYIESGGLYYIIDKTKDSKKDVFAKVWFFKKWNGNEYWMNIRSTINACDSSCNCLQEDTIELQRFKDKLNTELVKNVNDDWETIKETPKEVNLNPMSLIKSYINNRLSIHIVLLTIKWGEYSEIRPKYIIEEYVGLLVAVNLILVSPILLIIWVIKTISKLF